jgi:hypothetical protein
MIHASLWLMILMNDDHFIVVLANAMVHINEWFKVVKLTRLRYLPRTGMITSSVLNVWVCSIAMVWAMAWHGMA